MTGFSGKSMERDFGLIFDCDGVLLDSIHAWHEVDARLAQEAGVVFSEADRNALNASTLAEAAAYFHTRFGIGASAQDVIERINAYLLDFYEKSAEANPGALAFVRAAVDAGVPMCVLSSSPQSFLQAGLGRNGFLDLIGTVLSAEELPAKKRDPQLYPRVCEMLGVAPADAWLFDDSWYALAAAREAGLHRVGVFSADECGSRERLAAHSDFVIDSFEDLPFEAFCARVGQNPQGRLSR